MQATFPYILELPTTTEKIAASAEHQFVWYHTIVTVTRSEHPTFSVPKSVYNQTTFYSVARDTLATSQIASDNTSRTH